MMTLSEIAIYPIKSCQQIQLETVQLSPFGLSMDRRWMLIDENSVMLTQRKHARMCLIKCSLIDNQLHISAPGMLDYIVSMPFQSKSILATVWDDTCQAYDCGDETARWFSDFLKTSARLVFFPEDEFRQVDLNYAKSGDKTAFSDGFPYLLISQASLDDLNSKLGAAVEMRRFRPNLVIHGSDAFAEDKWKKIRIGDITFKLVKPCSRCIIPSIDPETAEKSAEPTKTLASYRMQNNKIFFGQNVIAEGSGTLQVGMSVQVIE